MSRFSKAEAEGLGWAFTHNADAYTTDLGDGLERYTPADLRAEKIVDGHVFTEQAETIGKLLERINAHEQTHSTNALEYSPEPDPDVPADNVRHDYTQENPIVPVTGDESEDETTADAETSSE